MIKIITDSAADIPRAEAEHYNIDVLAIPITLNGKTYMEGEDFDSPAFYKLLHTAKELPTTAQVTALRYYDAFSRAVREGARHIVCVTITSKGSGMYDAARVAKGFIFDEQPALRETVTIDVVDSGSYTYDYGHAVVDMAKGACQGKSLEDVLAIFRRRRETYQTYFGLTNLDYAKKSGRITSAAAFVGEVMGFRPIMTLHNGGTDTIGKVRGDQKLLTALLQLFQDRYSHDGRGFYILYSENKAMGVSLRKAIEKDTGVKCAGEYYIGASVTINAGPTVFGVTIPVDQVK